MNPKLKTTLIWIFAFFFTVATAAFQRMTGPTYPVRAKITIGSEQIRLNLLTSYAGNDDAPIFLKVSDRSVKGWISYKRFKSSDSLTSKELRRAGDYLVAFIPHQPPAGKVSYRISLVNPSVSQEAVTELTQKDVIIRFRGDIPASILLPHIIVIFLAMFFSTLTGLEAIFRRKKTLLYTWLTVITLFIGGLVLGPIVQKCSFNVYWTGWPFGHDMTDNKSLVAFIFWIIALVYQYRNREKRTWPIVAAIVMVVVFLIPHSILGSEIDYTKVEKTEAHGN
jgi:hypothetical protein